MTKTKIILVMCFLVTFAAGGGAGWLAPRPDHPRPPRGGFLDAELNLTEQQREQMHKIWTEAMRGGDRPQGDQRRVFGQERDQAIAALMTPEQKPQYEKILQDYARKVEELSQERKKAFETAVEQTKEQVLTPEQAAKYDELLKKQRERGFGGPPGPPPWGEKGGPPHGPRDRTGKDEREPSQGGK
jgi:Spy/CpxP family protein refolding chaperone